MWTNNRTRSLDIHAKWFHYSKHLDNRLATKISLTRKYPSALARIGVFHHFFYSFNNIFENLDMALFFTCHIGAGNIHMCETMLLSSNRNHRKKCTSFVFYNTPLRIRIYCMCIACVSTEPLRFCTSQRMCWKRKKERKRKKNRKWKNIENAQMKPLSRELIQHFIAALFQRYVRIRNR